MQNNNDPLLPDGPLSGVKVLDFTSVVVGPAATQVLADYGAEVIKIEPPEGDILRRMGGASQSGQLSPKFIQMNRSKRSLALDLKSRTAPPGWRLLMQIVGEVGAVARQTLGSDVASYSSLGSRFIAQSFSNFAQDSFAREVIDSLRISCASKGKTYKKQQQRP